MEFLLSGALAQIQVSRATTALVHPLIFVVLSVGAGAPGAEAPHVQQPSRM
jgi:hypothetical protein